MLLHRISALGRALLFAGGLALTALASGSSAQRTSVAEPERAAPTEQAAIASRDALPADDVRGSERVELVSIEVRSALRPPVASSTFAAMRRGTSDRLRGDALRWCDVIQCRRLGGAQLLGFATPPPTHS